jgi:hypothetical protein
MVRRNACPECGFANTPGARFCERCGTPLPWLRAWAIVVVGTLLLLAAGSITLLWSRVPEAPQPPATARGVEGVPAGPTAAQISVATVTAAPASSATPTRVQTLAATDTAAGSELVVVTETSTPASTGTKTPRPFNSSPAMTPTRLPTATPFSTAAADGSSLRTPG